MTLSPQITAILNALAATAASTGTPTVLYARTLGGFPVASIELPTIDFSDLEDSTVPIGQRRITLQIPLVVYVQLTNAGDDCALALSSTLAIVEALNLDPSLGSTVDNSQVDRVESFVDQSQTKPTAGYVVTCKVTAFIAG